MRASALSDFDTSRTIVKLVSSRVDIWKSFTIAKALPLLTTLKKVLLLPPNSMILLPTEILKLPWLTPELISLSPSPTPIILLSAPAWRVSSSALARFKKHSLDKPSSRQLRLWRILPLNNVLSLLVDTGTKNSSRTVCKIIFTISLNSSIE